AELQNELRKVSLRMASGARALVRRRADELRHLQRDVAGAAAEVVQLRRGAVQDVAGRLNTLSPLATLARGYAVARDEQGATLSDTSAFRDDMPFELVVRDGIVPARVQRKLPETP
ncbi:MAG: exodeoxyribonuclease VII large subunit, partial [Gemmatimonadaceae bacterium]